jgi:drug/metabolite transporter (DMT)-like permease
MSPLWIGICLALFSAVMTASAHYVWKAAGDRLVIRSLISGTSALCLLPFVFIVGFPDRALLPWLALSVSVHVFYQLAVIQAYNRMDFSLAFPLARGMAPLTAGLLGIVLLGDEISGLGLLGISCVTLGLLTLALSKGLPHRGLLAALVAGLLVTAYSLIDAKGVRLSEPAVQFIVWMFILDAILITTLAWMWRKETFLPTIKQQWKAGFLGGVVNVMGYAAILLAFRYVPVGVGSALRETSVIFAALLAVRGLKEELPLQRILGIALGVTGASLIVASGF